MVHESNKLTEEFFEYTKSIAARMLYTISQECKNDQE